MPHKRTPRFNKESTARVLDFPADNTQGGRAVARLVEREQKPLPRETSKEGSKDISEELTETQRETILDTIRFRRDQAQTQTDEIAIKMANWEKQYEGEWQNQTDDNDDHIFVGKTREMVQVVRAFMIMLLSQLPQLLSAKPQVSSIEALEEEWQKAKIAEAMLLYYFDDIWRFRDDVMPRWLNTFLKYSLGIMKVTWRVDSYEPDLKFDVVDRGFLYIDPYAHDLKDATWVLELVYMTRAEVQMNIDDGHWRMPTNKGLHEIAPLGPEMDDTLRRFFGDQTINASTDIEEDELIEVWHYWQSPKKGLDSVYAVVIGGEDGEVGRYGENPFPYKGHPFRGKSFDPHEWRVDGSGLVEMYRAVQEVVNTLFNLRLDDVRANIHAPVATTDRFVSKQTIQDFEDKNKLVRLDGDEVEAARAQSPNFNLGNEFAPLPIKTSTEGLFTDLQFIMGQGDQLAHASDAFKGSSPQKEATLGEIQEVLTRNMGAFRPIWLQVMKLIEEVGDIALTYFKDPEFFGESRIITVVGANKYRESAIDWVEAGPDVKARSIQADEMDIDVTINAVSGADQFMSRTFLAQSIQNVFASFGQIPGVFEEIRDDYDWGALVGKVFDMSGLDVTEIKRSPQEKQQIQQQRTQTQQQAQQQAVKAQLELDQATQTNRAKADIAIAQSKQQSQGQREQQGRQEQAQVDVQVDNNRMSSEQRAEIDQMLLAHQQTIERMMLEFRMELSTAQQGLSVSVGAGSNRLNQ